MDRVALPNLKATCTMCHIESPLKLYWGPGKNPTVNDVRPNTTDLLKALLMIIETLK